MTDDRAGRLARTHRQLTNGGDETVWETLTDAERFRAETEAGAWLVAAAETGLLHAPGPGPDEDDDLPRRVLSEDEEAGTVLAARKAAAADGVNLPAVAAADVVRAVLHHVGVLPPPPEPDVETCTALFPDEEGYWQQCADKPGHDPANGHDNGEWGWPDSALNSIPPTPTTAK